MSKFTDAIPEDIRANEHLTGIEDTGALASKYVGQMSKDFASQLPEDLRKNEIFKDMDVGKLATSYADIQGKVPVLPEDAKGYSFDFPENVPFNKADHKLFQDFALKEGLTQGQFKALNEYDIQRISNVMESYEAKRVEAWKQIKQDTGFKETEIEEKIEAVSKALGLGDLTNRLDLKSDPEFVKAMLSIKEKISEDVLKIAASEGKTRPTGPDGMPRLSFPDMES